jgi:hypothetical protein
MIKRKHAGIIGAAPPATQRLVRKHKPIAFENPHDSIKFNSPPAVNDTTAINAAALSI